MKKKSYERCVSSSSSSFNVLFPLWGWKGDGFPPFVSVLRCVLLNSQVLHILLDASPPALLWSSHRSPAWYLHPHRSPHGAILSPPLHMAKPSQSVPPQLALDVFLVTSPQHLLTWYSVLPSDTSHVPQHPLVLKRGFFNISSEELFLFCSSLQNINMFHLQETYGPPEDDTY